VPAANGIGDADYISGVKPDNSILGFTGFPGRLLIIWLLQQGTMPCAGYSGFNQGIAVC
jgi:hypothetical protein